MFSNEKVNKKVFQKQVKHKNPLKFNEYFLIEYTYMYRKNSFKFPFSLLVNM